MKREMNEIELLSAYIDGQLDKEELKEVNLYLASSYEARMELEKLLQSKSLLHALPVPPAPIDLLDSLEEQARAAMNGGLIEAPVKWGRVWAWTGSLAAAAAAVIALWLGVAPQRTIPVEVLLEAHARASSDTPLPAHVLGASIFSASGFSHGA
jgi:anti-sigma factor RsiW